MLRSTKVARAPQRTPSTKATHPSAEALLSHHRIRLHLGVLLALALIGLLAFVVFPLRQYRIQVDGVDRTLGSRQSGTSALLAQAQVEMLAGDGVRREQAADSSPVVAVDRALPIVLEVDGQRLGWRTRAQTVGGVLAEAGFTLDPYDTAALNGIPIGPRDRIDVPEGLVVARALSVRLPAEAMIPPDDSETTLTVRRAVPFTLREGDSLTDLSSGEATVGLALRQRGVTVGPGDSVQPPPSEPLVAGTQVTIERAHPVTLSVSNSRVLLYTRASTVGEVLEEAGVTLDEDQRVYPPLDQAVSNEENPSEVDVDTSPAEVRVVNVSDETYIESETVPYTTTYDVDASLANGETRQTLGSDGVLYREYRISYENGQEVYRELVQEWYDPEPVDAVVYYAEEEPSYAYEEPSYAGTEPVVAAGVPEDLNVVRTMSVYATYYTPASAGKPPSSPGYGIAATGVRVTYGVVAVDPSVIPLGTRMYIPGYGHAVAADTGGAIVGNIIDLGFPDGVAANWTPGWVEIYILGP